MQSSSRSGCHHIGTPLHSGCHATLINSSRHVGVPPSRGTPNGVLARWHPDMIDDIVAAMTCHPECRGATVQGRHSGCHATVAPRMQSSSKPAACQQCGEQCPRCNPSPEPLPMPSIAKQLPSIPDSQQRATKHVIAILTVKVE